MLPAPRVARSLARTMLHSRELSRLRTLRFRDAGHGYDLLGLHPDWVTLGAGLVRPLYDVYFRVTSHDARHIPPEGGAILAANHAGTLPVDASLLYLDILRHTSPPRVPRIVADFFVTQLPFVSVLFTRVGAVSGNRSTVRRLLEEGELVVIFPEGTPAIGKFFRERYLLYPFRVGHAELAIRHRVPVVPVAIIGAEEMWPTVARIRRLRPFGAPYLPIPGAPFPLPTHFHLWYGEPIRLHERWTPDQADDPRVTREAAAEVQGAVEALIEQGLREREGVFA